MAAVAVIGLTIVKVVPLLVELVVVEQQVLLELQTEAADLVEVLYLI